MHSRLLDYATRWTWSTLQTRNQFLETEYIILSLMCVLACACIYLYYKESMFMKGNIFKLQMDPLPPSLSPPFMSPPFSMWWCHVSNAYQSCTITLQCVWTAKTKSKAWMRGWWYGCKWWVGKKKEIISKHLSLRLVCLFIFHIIIIIYTHIYTHNSSNHCFSSTLFP